MQGRQMKTVVIKYRRRGFNDQYPEELSGFVCVPVVIYFKHTWHV